MASIFCRQVSMGIYLLTTMITSFIAILYPLTLSSLDEYEDSFNQHFLYLVLTGVNEPWSVVIKLYFLYCLLITNCIIH